MAVVYHRLNDIRNSTMAHMKLDMSYVTEWGEMWQKEDLSFRSSRRQSVAPKVDRWARENANQMPYFIKVITTSSSLNPTPSYSRHPRYRKPRPYRPSMTLPAIFVRENFRELQRNVILEDGFGNTWEVSFVSASASPVWRTGWTEFAVDNHLVTGDIVLFVLIANSHFRITIFDKHESLKKTANCSKMNLLKSPADNIRLEGQSSSSRLHVYQVSSESGNSDAQNYYIEGKARSSMSPVTTCKDLDPRVLPSKLEFEVVVVEISDTEEDLNELINGGHGQMNIGGAPCCHQINRPSHQVGVDKMKFDKMQFDPLGFTFISKREAPANHKRKAAKHAGEACVRTLKRPSVILVMEDSHVYQDFYLELPHAFAAELSLPASVTTALDFVDMSDGQSWEMQICKNTRNKFALHRRRWAVFSLHHFLEEGDVCVLELIDIHGATLIQVGVRIFRIHPLIPNSGKNIITIHDHYDMRVAI